MGSVERRFELCGRHVVAVAVEPLLVEPVHPREGLELELVDAGYYFVSQGVQGTEV